MEFKNRMELKIQKTKLCLTYCRSNAVERVYLSVPNSGMEIG